MIGIIYDTLSLHLPMPSPTPSTYLMWLPRQTPVLTLLFLWNLLCSTFLRTNYKFVWRKNLWILWWKKNHSLEHPFPSFHWPRLTIWAAKSCSTGHSCPCLYRRGVWIQETLPPISVLGILKESGHLFLGQRHLAHQRPWTQTAHLSGQPICLWGKVRVLF